MFAAKKLLAELGSHLLEGRQTGLAYAADNLAAVNFNTTFSGIETADAILIVGSQIRNEAPLLNVRLRKAAKKGAQVFIIGPQWDPTYKAEFLGTDAAILNKLPQHVWDALASAKRPAIIVGGAGLAKGALEPALAISNRLGFVRTLEDGTEWNGFNVLHMAASRMGGLMLGYAQKGGIADLVAAAPKLVISLGADEVDYSKFAGSMVVYIGHHGDKGAHGADIILPGAAFTEKNGIFVNTEGRVQFSERAVFAPGQAREDWTILRALADAFGVNVGFDSFEQLRTSLIADFPLSRKKVWSITARCPRAAVRRRARSPIRLPTSI
jgi:NADH-quinone oxidoreductase subunit G